MSPWCERIVFCFFAEKRARGCSVAGHDQFDVQNRWFPALRVSVDRGPLPVDGQVILSRFPGIPAEVQAPNAFWVAFDLELVGRVARRNHEVIVIVLETRSYGEFNMCRSQWFNILNWLLVCWSIIKIYDVTVSSLSHVGSQRAKKLDIQHKTCNFNCVSNEILTTLGPKRLVLSTRFSRAICLKRENNRYSISPIIRSLRNHYWFYMRTMIKNQLKNKNLCIPSPPRTYWTYGILL